MELECRMWRWVSHNACEAKPSFWGKPGERGAVPEGSSQRCRYSPRSSLVQEEGDGPGLCYNLCWMVGNPVKSRLCQGQTTSEAVLDPPLLLLASGGSLASLGSWVCNYIAPLCLHHRTLFSCHGSVFTGLSSYNYWVPRTRTLPHSSS